MLAHHGKFFFFFFFSLFGGRAVRYMYVYTQRKKPQVSSESHPHQKLQATSLPGQWQTIVMPAERQHVKQNKQPKKQ